MYVLLLEGIFQKIHKSDKLNNLRKWKWTHFEVCLTEATLISLAIFMVVNIDMSVSQDLELYLVQGVTTLRGHKNMIQAAMCRPHLV